MGKTAPNFGSKWIHNKLTDVDTADVIAPLSHRPESTQEMTNNLFDNGAMVELRISYTRTKTMSVDNRSDPHIVIGQLARLAVRQELPLPRKLNLYGR